MKTTHQNLNLLAGKALEIAVKEIGVKENGSNTSARIREYQAATTLDGTGWPWCSAFVVWAIEQAAKTAKVEVPGPRSASCDVMWADARKRGLMRDKPQPGFLFLVRAQIEGGYSKSDAIHIGWVREVFAREFKTIEGNTNADGGREGHSVLSHVRDISPRYAFFDPFAGLTVPAQKPTAPVVEKWRLTLASGGKSQVADVPSHDGRPMDATRDFAEFFGLPVTWDARNLRALLDGQEVPHQAKLLNGRSYYPVRVLGEMVGAKVVADAVAKTVAVSK